MRAIGVYAGNDPSSVRQFESWLGSDIDFVAGHGGRANWSDYVSSLSYVARQFGSLHLPIYWTVPMFVDGGTLGAGASGSYDAYYVQAAQGILAANPDAATINVRVGEEFNIPGMPWAAAGQEQNFIATYRHFVDSFRSVSSHFRFEWNVNIGGSIDPARAYPGDAYVDYVGMDFYYNTAWDSADPVTAWNDMVHRPYGLQWLEDFATAHARPSAYAEWGINSDTAGPYIARAMAWFESHNVAYQGYWDSDSAYAGQLSDGQYPTAGAAFRAAFGPDAPAAMPATAQPASQNLLGTASHDVHGTGGTVYALYAGLLDRAPDALGAESWAAVLDHGASLHDVTQGILTSAEGRSHFNAADNAGFVEQLYETVLGRHGDAAGVRAWTNALDGGASRAAVADGFVFSQEHVARLQPALSTGLFVADGTASDVARLYHGLLDRAPDAAGLQSWEAAAQAGTPLVSIAQSFLASGEYAAHNPTPLTDLQYVDSLYACALGRAPDAPGERGWTGALAAGTSRAQVALGIIESPEAQMHLLGQVEAGWHLF